MADQQREKTRARHHDNTHRGVSDCWKEESASDHALVSEDRCMANVPTAPQSIHDIMLLLSRLLCMTESACLVPENPAVNGGQRPVCV